jgi:hypothetical protein
MSPPLTAQRPPQKSLTVTQGDESAAAAAAEAAAREAEAAAATAAAHPEDGF